ncbi:MAG: Potassium channel [Sclerophora amabilis]|nr:MAG: Potassium channel [Sclerophora amabilis]
MNDPGLDAPINDTAHDVEKPEQNKAAELDLGAEAEADYQSPSRWWFTSTAFPLVAGTFGPMASAFSVCALVQEWRVYLPPGQNEAHGLDVPDPKWLIAINALSLILALIANAALSLNMARRLSFSIAQPITIVGWYVASLLLIALVAVASGPLRLPSPPPHALSQAFYYGIMAAALYFIVATLMAITVWGARRGHYKREFKLTTSQRTLMLQTISFLVYLLVSASIYAHLEGWAFLDAVYFADYTLLTVGTGDFTPSTNVGRGLLFPYSIGGIVMLGLVIGSIRSLILERGKNKIEARMVEKTRQRVLKSSDLSQGRINLTPFKKRHLGSNSSDERGRRKREFQVMREVQEQAAQSRRWTSLAISSTAWLVLWFVGAVVFWESEAPQGWTYFQSLYFSYISLLTIGYGDFYPQSNAGKAFFVFWSLLAVPTMTVLISNMGGTIIKFMKDLTLWVGSLTVLPGEGDVKGTFQRALAKFTQDKSDTEDLEAENGSAINSEPNSTDSIPKGSSAAVATAAGPASRLVRARETEHREESHEATEKGRQITTNVHLHRYLLVKELRNVTRHMTSTPQRKYTFDEWAWFLKLMGEDECSPATHRDPIVGREDETMGTAGFTPAADGKMSDQAKKWSWLGNRSPLMGNQDEPEWILERLSSTLEKELNKARQNHPRQEDAHRTQTESSRGKATD